MQYCKYSNTDKYSSKYIAINTIEHFVAEICDISSILLHIDIVARIVLQIHLNTNKHICDVANMLLQKRQI